MAKYNLNRETLPFFTGRVRAIHADTPRKWGQMDAARAMRHRKTVRILNELDALGETEQ